MFFNNNKIFDVKIMQIFYALMFLSQILTLSSIWILLLAVLINANSVSKNWDEKRNSQREQLRSQLRLIIHVLAYQNAAARTPYVAIIARTSNLSRVIIALRLQIYRLLVIERYVIPGGHMEMFIAGPADRE